MKLATFLAAICAAMLAISALPAAGQDNGPARILFESANRERVGRGLGPLKWSTALAAAANEHALRMAAKKTLSHQLPGEPSMVDRATAAGAHFHAVAENVAEGSTPEGIHQQWMHSPPHRANLLDPQLDSLGIAVAENGGVLFAVEDFSAAAAKLSVEEQEGIVDAKLRARGLQLLNDTSEARRSCVLDDGYAGSHEPSFVLHYMTPDLQSLPSMLEQRIKTGKYHSAVVGACAGGSKNGFSSSYRTAVLLFE